MNGANLYRDGVMETLAGFQLIEEQLKNYIEFHFDITRVILNGRLYFDFKRQDYQEAALGRLITVFSKICPNKDLIRDLQSVIKNRDHAAHQALLKFYSTTPISNEEYLVLIDENIAVMNSVAALLQRLASETEILVTCQRPT